MVQRKLKIIIVKNGRKPKGKQKIFNNWELIPHYFKELGHKVETIYLNTLYLYPFKCVFFRPDIIISIGKTVPYITSLHRMLRLGKKPVIIFDLTDHPFFYKSESRIKFFCKHHDYVTTSSHHNHMKYSADDYIIHGNDFKPLKRKIKYDACYVGKLNPFYGVDKLKKDCEENNIKLKIISDVPTPEVPEYIACSEVCVYPISWDSSAKMFDYAAMGKPVVAIKPNLAEKIDYPAYYTEDLVKGIKKVLKNKKLGEELSKESIKWFKSKTGTWKNSAEKYIEVFYRYLSR